MLLGNSHISTDKQNLDFYLYARLKHGCERFYTDIISGEKASRPGLNEMLKNTRSNAVIWGLGN